MVADPFAHLAIDGAPAGNTPQFKRKLPAGRHVIQFLDAKDDHELATRTIVLHDGETIELRP
jgi:hypothetical protein